VPEKRSVDSHLYEKLFGAFPVPLAVVDRELVIQYSNRNFGRLFAAEADLAGLDIGRFLAFREIKNLVGHAGRDRKSKEAELKLCLPRGESVFFKSSIIPFGLYLSARAQAGSEMDSLFLITLEDISERIRLEEHLLQAEKLSVMGQMAATISHELGNPLSIMITTLNSLRYSLQESDKELEEQIVVMEESAVRMHELLTSLADMSGLGRFQLEKENIHKAIMPVLSFVKKMAEKSGIRIEADLASELPPCCIDIRQLKQVFLNLLKNAMEAMSGGGTITVRSRHRPGLPAAWAGGPGLPARDAQAGTQPGLPVPARQTGGFSPEQGFVIVEVEDNGIGIPSADLETIFRPFYSTKRKGMGLGLALCRGIVEKHGGKIWAANCKGKGSCFIVELPVDKSL